jgi:hypothetical protein
MFVEIETRELHTKKKYSLISFADNYLPSVGTLLKDMSGLKWKVVDHFDGKVFLPRIGNLNSHGVKEMLILN